MSAQCLSEFHPVRRCEGWRTVTRQRLKLRIPLMMPHVDSRLGTKPQAEALDAMISQRCLTVNALLDSRHPSDLEISGCYCSTAGWLGLSSTVVAVQAGGGARLQASRSTTVTAQHPMHQA